VPSVRGFIIALDIPYIVDNKEESLVIVDHKRNIVMIFKELFSCDPTIRAITLHHVQCGLKCLKELNKNLVSGALSGNDIGMLCGIEKLFNFMSSNAVVVSVLVECLIYSIYTNLAHIATDSIHELINAQSFIVIQIEGIKKRRQVFLTDSDLEITARLCKLVQIKAV